MIKEILVKGAVQGVGYRPFIAFKAEELNISGFVKNIGAAVLILAIGPEDKLEALISYIKTDSPAGSFILDVQIKDLDVIPKELSCYETSFSIVDSTDLDLSKDIPVILPDIGICDDCKRELLETKGRRYRYYLNSCAVCGPRISILNALPYDRHNTTMGRFKTCKACDDEYKIGRRRYAQGLSCSMCGPTIRFKYRHDNDNLAAEGDTAVEIAESILKNGGIIGLKGVAGYQLVCKPTRDNAIRLRNLKHRENKPFAIMFFDEKTVKEYAFVSEAEEELLKSSARPIVLLKKKYDFDEEVVKGSRYIGAFLPSAGIHCVLTKEIGPLIVTSANSSDEPIITDDNEFMSLFFDLSDSNKPVCDGCLYHDLEINMPMDDSVAFVIDDTYGSNVQFIRRSRGYAPLPIMINGSNNAGKDRVVLAFGGDLKSTFAIGHNDKVMLSQQIGDLEDYGCQTNYRKLLRQYADIFKQEPNIYVCDLHPMYNSARIAGECADKDGIELIKLQHHFAHTYSVMAENSLNCAIGISFDGTGYGTDGAIWGGEFLYCRGPQMDRMGHLSYVTMVGGDSASKNAKQTRKCYDHMALSQNLISKEDIKEDETDVLLNAALENTDLCYNSSSMGRLFDAVSSLIGIVDHNSYEGECAINLEKSAWEFEDNKLEVQYPDFKFDITITEEGIIADQTKLFSDILKCQKENSFDKTAISYGFHMAIAHMILMVCNIIRDKSGEDKVCLSGGVFNNRLILTKSIELLKKNGFKVFWNRKVPLGDGGISLGQAYYGLMHEKE